MHLKSLTLRGFKSFASTTECTFSPGVNVIVGPNGSGKSNIADALLWVLGQQGAKSMRGASMQDVVFAGTANKPALGRAKVSLTLDNTDSSIDYPASEIMIERTMYRAGGSEYSLNGVATRLNDIQVLLAQAGISRGDHGMVGQGRVDQVLTATANERREILEEAFGIHRHRIRANQSERKLDSMKQNLHRLEDLEAELAQQIEPLRLQAQASRESAELYDQMNTLQTGQLRREAEAMIREEKRLTERLENTQEKTFQVKETSQKLTVELSRVAESAQQQEKTRRTLQEQKFQVQSLLQTTQSHLRLAQERQRTLATIPPDTIAQDLEQTQQQLSEKQNKLEQQEAHLKATEETLARLLQEEKDLKRLQHQGEKELIAAQESEREYRAEHARLLAELAGQRAHLERLEKTLEETTQQESHTEQSQKELKISLAQEEQKTQSQLQHITELEEKLHVQQDQRRQLTQEVAETSQRVHRLQSTLKALQAQREIFQQALENQQETEKTADLLYRALTVKTPWQLAVSVALSRLSKAVIKDKTETPNLEDITSATVFRPHTNAHIPQIQNAAQDLAATDPTIFSIEDISVPATEVSREILIQALANVVFTVSNEQAISLALKNPGMWVIDQKGNIFTHYSALPHEVTLTNPLELTAKIADLDQQIEEAQATLLREQEVLNHNKASLEQCRSREKTIAQHLGKASAELTDTQSALAVAQSQWKDRKAAKIRVQELIHTHQKNLQQSQEKWQKIQQELSILDSQREKEKQPELAESVAAANQSLQEVRIQLATHTKIAEHARQTFETSRGELKKLADRTAAMKNSLLHARHQAEARHRLNQKLQHIHHKCELLIQTLQAELTQNDQETSAVKEEQQNLLQEQESLEQKRQKAQEHQQEQQKIYDALLQENLLNQVHRQNLEQKIQQQVALSWEELMAREPLEISDQEIQQQLLQLQESLNALGRVNPLAVEECEALEERHRYLIEQINDLKKSRADVRSLIKSLHSRMKEQFVQSFSHAASAFERIFADLFDGGEGKLILTDPQDVLSSGVDIQARPSGKKVKRLSLLSGGERTLTSLAFLAALFSVRPAPFYVLDEVEAALDDRNLARVHRLFDQLSSESQLLIITHKPRTVELAETLVGISMQDGVSFVLSQNAEYIRSQL